MIHDSNEEETKKMGEQVAKAQDDAIIKELSALFLEPNFLKWFREHYDFYVIRTQPTFSTFSEDRNMFKVTVTQKYGHYGPVWLPFKVRLKRKITRTWKKVKNWFSTAETTST